MTSSIVCLLTNSVTAYMMRCPGCMNVKLDCYDEVPATSPCHNIHKCSHKLVELGFICKHDKVHDHKAKCSRSSLSLHSLGKQAVQEHVLCVIVLMYIDAHQAQVLSQFANTGRGPSILKLGYQCGKSLNLLFACSTEENAQARAPICFIIYT